MYTVLFVVILSVFSGGAKMDFLGKLVRFCLRRAGLVILPVEVKMGIILDPEAKMPTQPYPTDACWDIYASEDVWVRPGIATNVPTGVYMDIPEGYEVELKARSSQGKAGLIVHHGTIDAGYQGEISPIILNFTPMRVEIQKGDRVAQCCLRRKCVIKWEQVASFPRSDRGAAGFGSSGR